MEQEKMIHVYDRGASSVAFPALMKNVYLWMTLALAVTGMTAYYIADNPGLIQAVLESRGLFFGLVIAELALVWILSANIMRMSFATAGLMFVAYSILNGVTMSFIFLAYTMESIATTFFVTAGTFGAMTIVGYTIKRDLSAMGRFLFMALIGLIIATIVNLFVASSTLGWALTYIGVLIFVGLTAYDTQKIKEMLLTYGSESNEQTMKLALIGSLTLYLDFINLFIYLLRIFGDRK